MKTNQFHHHEIRIYWKYPCCISRISKEWYRAWLWRKTQLSLMWSFIAIHSGEPTEVIIISGTIIHSRRNRGSSTISCTHPSVTGIICISLREDRHNGESMLGWKRSTIPSYRGAKIAFCHVKISSEHWAWQSIWSITTDHY